MRDSDQMSLWKKAEVNEKKFNFLYIDEKIAIYG